MKHDIKPHLPDNFSIGHFMIIGEAPGAEEVKQGKPFVGRSGKLLCEVLEQCGVNISDTYITNVFYERPPNNDVNYFFSSRMSAIRQDLEINESIPTLRGKYVKVPYDEAIARLYEEIITVQPRMILTVGATPMWAVTGKDKITEGRGFTTMTIAGKEFPVMSTFHPAGILRRREWYDLFKSDIKQAVENANRLC
tara:strand:- start:1284 stop:1868 length:585 start_codon:yes stop_codon:yes gene_type:complete